MAYIIELEDEGEALNDIPTTTIRSKADVAGNIAHQQASTLSTNDIVINKLTQVEIIMFFYTDDYWIYGNLVVCISNGVRPFGRQLKRFHFLPLNFIYSPFLKFNRCRLVKRQVNQDFNITLLCLICIKIVRRWNYLIILIWLQWLSKSSWLLTAMMLSEQYYCQFSDFLIKQLLKHLDPLTPYTHRVYKILWPYS